MRLFWPFDHLALSDILVFDCVLAFDALQQQQVNYLWFDNKTKRRKKKKKPKYRTRLKKSYIIIDHLMLLLNQQNILHFEIGLLFSMR